MQLVGSGEDDHARDALRRWATAYARLHGARLPTAEQLAAIDALSAEEVNLADEIAGRSAAASGSGVPRSGPVARRARGRLGDAGRAWCLHGDSARALPTRCATGGRRPEFGGGEFTGGDVAV